MAEADAPEAHSEGDQDAALVRAVAQGNQHAFEQLIARHGPRLIGMATKLTGSRSDAEEVAQDAFARVWINAGRWRSAEDGGSARFSTWLYRVAVNLCIDRKRRPVSANIDDVPEPIDESADAFSGLVDQDVSRQVRTAVAALPERQRTALVLCFYEGLSNAEAGGIMNLSIGAVESLLVRARRSLRERLENAYAELGQD